MAQRDNAVDEGEELLHLARVLPRARGVEQDRVPQAPQRHLYERRVRGRLAQQVRQAASGQGAVLLGVVRELALLTTRGNCEPSSRGGFEGTRASRERRWATHGEHLAEKPLGEVFHGEHGRVVAKARAQ